MSELIVVILLALPVGFLVGFTATNGWHEFWLLALDIHEHGWRNDR